MKREQKKLQLWVDEVPAPLAEAVAQFQLKNFDPFLGCPLVIPHKKPAQTEELTVQPPEVPVETLNDIPNSAFKIYVFLQNGFDLVEKKTVDDYIDEFFPEPTPLSVAFYLNYKRASQALSKMDEIQMRRQALSLIAKTAPTSVEAVASRFVASLSLDIQNIDEIIQIQKETIDYFTENKEEVLKQKQTILDAGLLGFPLEIMQLTLAASYSRNMQHPLAIQLLKELSGFEMECAELLFHSGQSGSKQALETLLFDLQRSLEQNGLEDAEPIVNELKTDFVYNDKLLELNLQEHKFTTPAHLQCLRPYAIKVTFLGELLNNPQLFALAVALNARLARPLRDLGTYCVTEFKQTKLGQEVQKKLIVNSSYLLMCAHKLDPYDRTCRENLGALLILTKSQLDKCRQIYVNLIADFGETQDYYQNIALIDYAQNNFKSAMEFYLRAMKLNYTWDVTLVYQVLQLLVDLKEKQNSFKTDQVLFILEQQLVVFYMYKKNMKWAKEKEIIYIQNFLWHVNPHIEKLFNWICDMREKKGIWENGRRIFNQWLQLAADHCATEAGDEVLGTYLNIHKRFEQ